MTNQIDPLALKTLIDAHAVKVIDGSMPPVGVAEPVDVHALYLQAHIPGAVFFDLDRMSDHHVPLPHTLLSAQDFAAAVGAMGISSQDHVVVYDRDGLFSAARVWWNFKLMGHENIQVLRGGLPAWIASGLPTTATVPTPVVTTYQPFYNADMVIDLSRLRFKLDSRNDVLVLDARSAPRFTGQAAEPRAGLRSGHMPGARNLPFSTLLRNGALKSVDELEAIFDGVGLRGGQTAITTCGSGVTAAVISMALAEVGHTQAILYDGSWAEWGQETLDTPVVKGET